MLVGGFVDTKDRVTVTELTKGTFNSSGQLEKTVTGSTCGYEEEQVWIPCSQHVHDQNNIPEWLECEAERPPSMYTIISWNCHYTTDVGTPGNPGGGEGANPGGETGNIPTQPVVLSYFPIFVKNLPADLKVIINAPENIDFYNNLLNYFDASYGTDEVKNRIKWALQFKQSNSITWEKLQPMLTLAHNFLQENPDTENPEQIFTRIKDLDNALVQNPNLLLDIPCSQLPAWNIVANHQVSQALKDKLNNIQGQTNFFNGWEIQNIDNASGPRLNMDLFPIRITNMPYKPNSNQKYSPAEFFDYFRKNINDFVDPTKSQFFPIVEPISGIDETNLWNSNNPLGALVTIQIPGDDGTVMCTGYNGEAWVFTTIKAPIKLDGTHPVSGHRLFGYWVDNNGFMYLFTRGVDRFTKPITNYTLSYFVETFAFSEADKLWESMQTKVENFINNPENGGLANKITPVTYRPAYPKIKNYLKGTATIQSLGCN